MKDYDLVISSNDDMIKFTVKDSSRLVKAKYPVVLILVGFVINLILAKRDSNGHIDILRILSHLTTSEMILTAVAVLGAMVILCAQDPEDTMIVMKQIGVQLSCKSRWKFLTKPDKNVFIPLSNIIDLVVHEGFYGYGQVIYYMCVLTKSNNNSKKDDMIKVVFSELLPRKDLLITVWKQSRSILFGNKRHFRRVPGQGLKLVE